MFACIFFVPLFTVILPMTHKIFRNSLIYFFSLIFALVIAIIFLFKLNITLQTDKVFYFVCSLSPITFLLLYKLFDYIIKLKFNRHIYFFVNFISYKDGESENRTWLDHLFQMILFIIPGFWFYIGYLIF